MVRWSVKPSLYYPDGASGWAALIVKSEAAAIRMGSVDALVNDEMVEAWLWKHPGSLDEVSEDDLAAVVMWFPIIGVAVNDRSTGVLIPRDPVT